MIFYFLSHFLQLTGIGLVDSTFPPFENLVVPSFCQFHSGQGPFLFFPHQ